MIRLEKMTYDMAVTFNSYIDDKIIKYALFDSNFVEEFNYYASDNINNLQGTINNYLYAIYDDIDPIGYIVLNIFIDEKNNLVGCSINPIIIFKEYRKCGYGYQVLEILKDKEVINENIKYLECLIDKDNKESISLFSKSNFHVVYSKENFVCMRFKIKK